ncbi:MAG: hypothetical protein ACYCQJ_12365 [Nitrososphaerales archaeon]
MAWWSIILVRVFQCESEKKRKEYKPYTSVDLKQRFTELFDGHFSSEDDLQI